MICVSLKRLICETFGSEMWVSAHRKAGLPLNRYSSIRTYSDSDVMLLLRTTLKIFRSRTFLTFQTSSQLPIPELLV